MRRGYCEGGPLHGQVKDVNKGYVFVDSLTHARYGWVENKWVYMGDDRLIESDCSVAASPARSPTFVVNKQ